MCHLDCLHCQPCPDHVSWKGNQNLDSEFGLNDYLDCGPPAGLLFGANRRLRAVFGASHARSLAGVPSENPYMSTFSSQTSSSYKFHLLESSSRHWNMVLLKKRTGISAKHILTCIHVI